MSDRSKITAAHLRRRAFVYLRQSSPGQVLHNRESTDRQYALVNTALELGWSREQIEVIDEDLGVTAEGVVERSGFERVTAQVAFGRGGIVLGIEVLRLARNNAEWYRLLDLCGVSDTLVGEEDGVYHPGVFNDRLLLGLKGTMSEAELHVLRAHLQGGIRNKAARGEMRRGLPVGFVRGEGEGEVLFHPDEAVTAAMRTVFERFAEMGSARQVWLWLRSQEILFPLQSNHHDEIRWVAPTYGKIHQVLTNPVYTGAYVFGKSRQERYIGESGKVRKRMRRLPRSEWSIAIHGHHPGIIVLVLPDGTRALIPGSWTDLHGTPDDQSATLTSLAQLLRARTVVHALLRRLGAAEHDAPQPEAEERAHATADGADELAGDTAPSRGRAGLGRTRRAAAGRGRPGAGAPDREDGRRPTRAARQPRGEEGR